MKIEALLARGRLHRTWYTDGALLFGVAFVVRVWNIGGLGFSHWDEAFFVQQGRALAANWVTGIQNLGYSRAPATSVALALFFKILGSAPWVAFLVPMLAGSAAVVACYSLGRDLYGRRAGLVAGSGLVVSEFAVMYSRLVLADSLLLVGLLFGLQLLWRASKTGRLSSYLAVGLWSGLLFTIKFNGFYLALLAGAWLGCLTLTLIPRAFRSPTVRQRIVNAWLGMLVLVCCTAACMAAVLWLVAPETGGVRAVVQLFLGYSVGSGVHIVTPASLVGKYFLAWASAPTLALAALGAIAAVRRPTSADGFVALFGATYFASVLFYLAFPRLALPLFPVLFLLAGRGVIWLSDGIGRLAERGHLHLPAIGIATALATALVLGEASRLPRLLSMRTLGYAQAAARIAQLGGNAVVYEHTQPVLGLYTDAAIEVNCTSSVTAGLRGARPKILVIDQTAGWERPFADFLQANSDRLAVQEKIPNPLYDEVLVQPATDGRLAARFHPPEAYRYIVLLRSQGPLDTAPLCR